MSKMRVSDGVYKADDEMVAAALCFVDLIRDFMRGLKTAEIQRKATQYLHVFIYMFVCTYIFLHFNLD